MLSEINNLIDIGAIRECEPCRGQFLSSIFLIKKSNGKNRFILNLKNLNHFVHAPHFKLEDYRTAMKLVNRDDYMCSIDLKDAYFSITIHEDYRKYLRFLWLGRYYEFQVLPFGLNIAPYVFTKLMRPVMHYLRNKGFLSVIYLDDLLLMSNSYLGCTQNYNHTKHVLEWLGFTINLEKSSSVPCQSVTFLGFVLNSANYSINVPIEKRQNIKKELIHFRGLRRCKLRNFAHLIGLLVSICPAVQYGWVYTKNFERVKYLSLQQKEDYDQFINLPKSLDQDFNWWLRNIDTCFSPIRINNYQKEIFTDASRTGWGASCSGQTASGQWTYDELKEHINFLELTAAFFGLKVFARNLRNCEILLRIDNSTAISYINRMGGIRYPHLNDISKKIWQWCEERNLYVFASYISSKNNCIADYESRRVHADVEWEISNEAYRIICRSFGSPDIDLFASRVNNKCHKFVSWHRDPAAYAIDAFTLCWSTFSFYAFPPFCLVLKVLQKIAHDKAEGIVVVPKWPTQPWYPLFKSLLIHKPIEFSPNPRLLTSPYSVEHKMHRSLTLVAGVLSGRHSLDKVHRRLL